MRLLLDKNIVRYALVALRFGRERQLTEMELGSLQLIRRAVQRNDELFISHTSRHILQNWQGYREIQTLLGLTSTLNPTKRYYKRWSRRIRETSGLAREDAAIIALASFGRSQESTFLTMVVVITYDQPMINGYRQHYEQLQQRLENMTRQLPTPFNKAQLPALALSNSDF